MTDAISRAVDAAFRHFGVDATYSPSGGAALPDPVRAIVRNDPLAGGSGLAGIGPVADVWTLDVRAAELPGGIASKGDTFVTASGTFTVTEAHRDARGVAWTLNGKWRPA
jgi:hypothetical protein